MDMNNQYGMVMTLPLPYGCIKLQKTIPYVKEVEELLKTISLEDKTGHIFTVNIEFADINPKTLLFNEIYPPIFEKNKKSISLFTRMCILKFTAFLKKEAST